VCPEPLSPYGIFYLFIYPYIRLVLYSLAKIYKNTEIPKYFNEKFGGFGEILYFCSGKWLYIAIIV